MLTLLCLYLPPHHVLKEDVKWTEPQLGRGWRLSLKKLVRGVIKERNKAWDKAKRFLTRTHNTRPTTRHAPHTANDTTNDTHGRLYAEYEAGVERQEAGKGQGGLRMVKKNLAHGIRYLVLGRALAERGAIDDFAAANHYHHQLMAHRDGLDRSSDNDDKSSSAPTVTGWDRWEARYRPIYQQLERQFRELVESEIGAAVAQQLRREEACRQQQRQWPAVVDYLRESVAAQQVPAGRDDTDAALESALSALTRVFAIQISRHPQFSRYASRALVSCRVVSCVPCVDATRRVEERADYSSQCRTACTTFDTTGRTRRCRFSSRASATVLFWRSVATSSLLQPTTTTVPCRPRLLAFCGLCAQPPANKVRLQRDCGSRWRAGRLDEAITQAGASRNPPMTSSND